MRFIYFHKFILVCLHQQGRSFIWYGGVHYLHIAWKGRPHNTHSPEYMSQADVCKYLELHSQLPDLSKLDQWGTYKSNFHERSVNITARSCAGNSRVTGEFPAQRTSNAENVSIWWRHHLVRIAEKEHWHFSIGFVLTFCASTINQP